MSEPRVKKTWQELQRKVFTKWINDKFKANKKKEEAERTFEQEPVDETKMLEAWGDGLLLANLMETLSEVEFTRRKKMRAAPKNRIHQVENVANALSYALNDCKLKVDGITPSAENFIDQEERSIMGFIWSLMRTYIRFDANDSRLGLKQALLMWVQKQTQPYDNVNVKNFTKSWHNGLAFCALIHKFRPDLIGDWDKLDPANAVANIRLGMEGANKFFGLEMYIDPEDVADMDDKSMIIYVSEWYAGLAAYSKVDMRKKRIKDAISAGRENKKFMADYAERARLLKQQLDVANEMLAEEFTAGQHPIEYIQTKVQEMEEFKTGIKDGMVAQFLEVEALFNEIQVRLAQQGRPKFVPPQGLGVKELRTNFSSMDRKFQQKELWLHEELNRLRALTSLDALHKSQCDRVNQWAGDLTTKLGGTEEVTSVSRAQYLLNTINSARREVDAYQAASTPKIKALGQKLEDAKYHALSSVRERENIIDTNTFPGLSQVINERELIFKDDLAREQFKDSLRLKDQSHASWQKQLMGWTKDCASRQETISSQPITSAQSASWGASKLKALSADIEVQSGRVAELQALGKELVDGKYESSISSYVFENPDAIAARESEVVAAIEALRKSSQEIQTRLDDDVKRETFKADILLKVPNHEAHYASISRALAESKAFLDNQPANTSVPAAKGAMDALKGNILRRAAILQEISSWKKLGNEIAAAEYKSDLSEYKYDQGEALTTKHAEVWANYQAQEELTNTLKARIEDDIQRETVKQNTELNVRSHADMAARLNAQLKETRTFLEQERNIDSVPSAEWELSQLAALNSRNANIAQQVANLKALGASIVESKYNSDLSNWAVENPEAITATQDAVETEVAALAEVATELQATLGDKLKLEEFKQETSLRVSDHSNQASRLNGALAELKASLDSQPVIDSIQAARAALDTLKNDNEARANLANQISSLKTLGQSIQTAEYKSERSEWRSENQESITSAEAAIDAEVAAQEASATEKQATLGDALAREEYKQDVELWSINFDDQAKKLQLALNDIKNFFEESHPVDSIANAYLAVEMAKVSEANRVGLTGDLEKFSALATKIVEAKYTSDKSSFSRSEEANASTRATEADITGLSATVATLATEQFAAYSNALAFENSIDTARIDFAQAATEFESFAATSSVDAKAQQFGTTLQEVENFKIVEEAGAIKATLDTQLADCKTKFDVLEAIQAGATNQYSEANMESLNALGKEVSTAVVDMEARYASELQTKQEQDRLCSEFATLANPFQQQIDQNRQQVSEETNLEACLALIRQYQGEVEAKTAELKTITEVSDKVVAAGVLSNPHSPYTGPSVQKQFDQYISFLKNKGDIVEAEIEHAKLRGVTPEQYSSIKEQFAAFDLDKSGTLETVEFKKALFSLGESKTDDEIKELMGQYGADGKMPFEGFQEYMVVQLGGEQGKAKVLEDVQFVLGKETKEELLVTDEELLQSFSPEDIEYIKSRAPPGPDGKVDLNAWLEAEYATSSIEDA